MTTTTQVPVHRGGGLPGSIAAEWTKLVSVRSTWWSLLGACLLMALYTVGIGIDTAHPPDDAAGMPRSALMLPAQDAAAGGMLLAQFALLVLAVLAVTTEYATGSIRSTLQCDPCRGRVLGAKLVVLVPAVFVTGSLVALLGAVAADVSAGEYGLFVPGDVAEAVLRMGLYLALAAMLATGLGTVLRSTAGTLTATFLLLLLLPVVLLPTGVDVLVTVAEYLPGTAGMEVAGSAAVLGFTDLPYGEVGAVLVFLAWSVGAALAGYAVLRTRDA